jgi:hypothetical protein
VLRATRPTDSVVLWSHKGLCQRLIHCMIRLAACMACLIVAARARCAPRAVLARSRHIQAINQPAQLSPQPSMIFWTRRPLKALQLVLEFIQDWLQAFA